jgi:secretion/DNA translocation related TadE-like protein
MKARADAGSASVYVLVAMVFVGLLAAAVALVSSGLALHRQAVRAADLAALAGAQRALVRPAEACDAARTVAEANGGVLTTCDVEPPDVRVVVEVQTEVPWLPPIQAGAAAGPR